MLSEPSDVRLRISRFTFKEAIDNCPLGQLEDAFNKICAVEDLEKRIQKAVKSRDLLSLTLLDQIKEAEENAILTKEEACLLHEAELARQQVIHVDDFSSQELSRN